MPLWRCCGSHLYEVERRVQHAARPGFRIMELQLSPTQKVPWHSHCACRKSNSHIQMMKSAKKWRRHNATNGMYCSRRRRVLVD